MRPAPCHRPLRIAQTVYGRAQQLTCADGAGQPRQHRDTVDSRRQRDHRRDAPVVGGEADNVTAGVRNAPQHNAFRVDVRQPPGSGNRGAVIPALAWGRHQLARRPARPAEPAVVEQQPVESASGEAARIVHQGAGVPSARESRCHHHARHSARTGERIAIRVEMPSGATVAATGKADLVHTGPSPKVFLLTQNVRRRRTGWNGSMHTSNGE